jgi:hypothetical protein
MPCSKAPSVTPWRRSRPRNRRRSPRPTARGDRIAPAELEGDAAEDEAEQHRGERRVERRQDDRVGQWKGREQPAAAQHQPGLVAVPDRRDRVHRLVPLLADAKAGKEDADAEIEAVHDHVHRDGKGDQERPDDGEI